ncbi:serine protease 58 isoform X2 [Gorilla gorilla gorilla]|nr:serine protease 58 isoform X2 [Gorilla gorilla gorilla]XP_055202900.1 serine protease 58 isoform X2 [Gorilla gorilla gorilla]
MKFILLWALLNLTVALAFNPDYTVSSTPPYLVYLKSDYLPCAGVLIHPLWVITAAHCNLPKLRVILGVTIPADSNEKHLQVIGYEKMIHHPHFSVTSIDHDIMLIKLKTEAELNDYVKLANLPYQTLSENTMCSVSTWSYNVCDIYKEPDSLQTVNISVISKPQCRDAYKTYNITENMLCVGIVPGRRQPCKEVSAAPAICNGMLQGILSFADGCVLRADVGIYAKIFYYTPWIENVIQNN